VSSSLPQYSFSVESFSNGNSLIAWRGADGAPYQLYTTGVYFAQNDPPLLALEIDDPGGDYQIFLNQFENGNREQPGNTVRIPPGNAASLTLAALPKVEQDTVGKLTAVRQEVVDELALNGGSNTQTSTVAADLGEEGFFRLVVKRDDTDDDGLFDNLEPGFGTNPFDPDSDQDGVTDPWDLAGFDDVIISEFMAANDGTLPRDEDGDFEDYIELFNPTSATVDLTDYYLACESDDLTRWRIPNGVSLAPGESLLVFASGKNRTDPANPLHTDFGLSEDGEDVFLVKAQVVNNVVVNINIVDSHVNWGAQRLNTSAGYGLNQEDGVISALRYFNDPSPGALNPPSACPGWSMPPDFNRSGGVFSGGVETVSISASHIDDEIFYTLDGSNPTTGSPKYTGQVFQFDQTTVLRAVAARPGCFPSTISTSSFLFKEDVIGTGGQGNPAVDYQVRPEGYPVSAVVAGAKVGEIDYAMDPQVIEDHYDLLAQELGAIPSVSLVLPVDLLFGPTNGIYSRSEDTESLTDPLGNDWKRLASIEYIDPATPGNYRQENGEITISGGSSRQFSTTDKHNLRMIFKSRFSREGTSDLRFENSPFVASGQTRFSQLTLRNPTQDSWAYKDVSPDREDAVHIKEGWAREMHRRMNPARNIVAHRRWVHLYLNGNYWGVYDLGERIDEDFVRAYAGDLDDYDVVKNGATFFPPDAVDGGNGATDAYASMIAACQDAAGDTGDTGNWDLVGEHLDLKNYIDYLMVEMFMDNFDWGANGNNMRAFRRRTDPGDPDEIAQFRFVIWDVEWSMEPGRINADSTGASLGAAEAHWILLNHPDYQAAWKARVQEHFETPGGVFSVSGGQHMAATIFQEQMDLFEILVTAESARWGDSNRAVPYGIAEWTLGAEYLRDTYLRGPVANEMPPMDRRSKFLNQLRARGLANPAP